MVRINWDEVEATKIKLFRSGATDSLEMIVIVFYHTKSECDKIQIRLGQLEKSLFEIGANEDVKGIFLYDISMKKPYFKCEEPNRVDALEVVPSSGHPNVLLEFEKMTSEARDVWVEITFSELQHYIR